LTAPEVFKNYIISSPSLWWNHEEVWRWEEEYSDCHDDLKANVFVGAGGLETVEGSRAQLTDVLKNSQGQMRDGVQKLLSAYDKMGWPRMSELSTEFASKLKLREYPNLKIYGHNMPDETHTSVPFSIFSRGLRYVFGNWRPEEF